ncbi:MAG: restriction endonuclease subunit S [Candidatus Scalindua sp.]
MNKLNENRPGYKKTKVGWIPENWEYCEFAAIAKIEMGQSPNGSSYNTEGKGYPLINGPTEFTDRYPIKKQWTSSPTKICNPGDILLCVRGSSTGRINIANGEYCIGRGIAAICHKEKKGHPIFIEQLLINITTRILRLTTGSTFPNIDKNTLSSIEIGTPPLPEQKKIAEIFSAWDKAIEQVGKLIDVKEKRFKGLVQTFISNQCDNWDHLKGREIFDSISEKNHPDEELLSVTQDRGVIPRTMLEGKVMSPEGSTAMYKLIKEDDFVISLRSFQGGIEYSRYQGIISPAYTVLRPKIELHDDFYRHFFKTYLFIGKYLRIAVIGIRDGKQISIPDFMTVKIPYPPLDQQKQIGSILNTAQQEINLLKRFGESYCKQKRGLMQKLLTGNIRVKVLIKERTGHGSSEKRK